MGLLRDRMMHDLTLAGYKPKTTTTYLNAVRDFAAHHRRPPTDLSADHVRAWMDRLRESGIGPQRIRQHIAALKFFFTKTIYKPGTVSFLSWPRNPKRLPTVLEFTEVERLLLAPEHPKYRVFFTTVYATGLRVNEACKIQTGDIDAARSVHVRQAKGDKDRYVMLSARLLAIMRAYWAFDRPPAPWMFAAKRTAKPLRAETARLALSSRRSRPGLPSM